MSVKQKIAHGRELSKLNLGILVCSFDVCRASKSVPLLLLDRRYHVNQSVSLLLEREFSNLTRALITYGIQQHFSMLKFVHFNAYISFPPLRLVVPFLKQKVSLKI